MRNDRRDTDDADGRHVRTDKPELIRVCSPLNRIGYVTNVDGGAPAHLVEIETLVGSRRIEILETDLAQPRELKLKLLDSGARLKDDDQATTTVVQYLKSFAPRPLFKRVIANGWLYSGGCGYVFGDKLFGPTSTEMVQRPSDANSKFDHSGDIEAWRACTQLLENNPLLVAPLCFALAAPLLRPLGQSTFAVSLVGHSSTGKTTALRLAQALLGSPYPLATWSGTLNGLRASAVARNDLPLILDEIGQANPRDIAPLTYDLTNGVDKHRANPTGTQAQLPSFATTILSAGEESLADRMGRAGQTPTGGHAARFITLQVDGPWGVVSDPHGSPDSATFIRNLNATLRKTYGIAWPIFVEHVAKHVDQLKSDYRKRRSKIIDGLTADLAFDDSDNIALRVMDHFLISAFAGYVAVDAGVIDLPKKVIGQSIRACFSNWFSEYSASQASAGSLIIKRVLEIIQKRQKKIFPFDEYNKREAHAPFAYRYMPTKDGEALLLVRPEAFDLLKEKYGVREFHEALQESGWIEQGSGGKPSKQFKVPGGSGARFRAYAFRESFLNKTV
ncbi:DUF927 domain-containing protein [Paraburkholderia fungorum]|uniref:DUF927 domain-containing protein n=1 Tax=Paraburkholderia fungorum TaxID=134537 RepID=UPI0038BDDD76